VKRIRRIVLLVSLVVVIGAVILLLNFTAPNPTGRRYSSHVPLSTGQANAQDIGNDGERILAMDLGIPNNNASDQRQCLCQGDRLIRDCNVCLPVANLSTAYRIPDFITVDYIAESKNVRGLLYDGREVDQIADYATAARLLKRPLWLYVRVNTLVAPEFRQVVEATGGGVIPYFTVDSYVDPIDQIMFPTAAVSGGILVVMIWLELGGWRRIAKGVMVRPVPGKSPTSPQAAGTKGARIDAAEDFLQQARSRLQAKIDRDDEWNDL